MTKNTFGKAIVFFLQRKSLSSEKLANLAGIQGRTLSDAMSGSSKPHATTRKAIIDSLEVTVEQFNDVEIAIEAGKNPRDIFKIPASQDQLQNLSEHLNTTNTKLDQIYSFSTKENLQPKLTSGVVEDNTAFFYFGSRNFELQDRDSELKTLIKFAITGSRKLSWMIISGPAGVGKSRLALEVALILVEKHGWAAGFLEDWEHFDWENWQPSKPTLMIIDYAASRIDTVCNIIKKIISKPYSMNESNSIRLILIERTTEVITDVLLLESRETMAAYSSFSGLKIPLLGLTSPFELVKNICQRNGKKLEDLPSAAAGYNDFDPNGKPLFAMLYAYSLLHEELIGANLEVVCRTILHRWETRFWKLADLQLEDRILLVISTILGGAAVNDLQDIMELPANPMKNINSSLLKAGLSEVQNYVTPLEPDLLGELYVLDQLESNDINAQYIDNIISKIQKNHGILVQEFLKRIIADFPDHAAIKIFISPLGNITNETKALRSDLLMTLPDAYLTKYVSKDNLVNALDYASKPRLQLFTRENEKFNAILTREEQQKFALTQIDYFSNFFYKTHLTSLIGFVWKFTQSGLGAIVTATFERIFEKDKERFTNLLISTPLDQTLRLLTTCRHNKQLKQADRIEEILISESDQIIEYAFILHPYSLTKICQIIFTTNHNYPISMKMLSAMKTSLENVDIKYLFYPSQTEAKYPYNFLSYLIEIDAPLLSFWADKLFSRDLSELDLDISYNDFKDRYEPITSLIKFTNVQSLHKSWRNNGVGHG